jgi:hypothetical protein
MLTRLHRVHCELWMKERWHRNHDRINVRIGDEVFVVRVYYFDLSLLSSLVCAREIHVCDGYKLGSRNLAKGRQVSLLSNETQAYNPNTNFFLGQTQHETPCGFTPGILTVASGFQNGIWLKLA